MAVEGSDYHEIFNTHTRLRSSVGVENFVVIQAFYGHAPAPPSGHLPPWYS